MEFLRKLRLIIKVIYAKRVNRRSVKVNFSSVVQFPIGSDGFERQLFADIPGDIKVDALGLCLLDSIEIRIDNEGVRIFREGGRAQTERKRIDR